MPADRREFLAIAAGGMALPRVLFRSGSAALDIPALLAVTGVPAISLTSIEPASTTHRQWGHRLLDGTGTVNADTRFEAASLSKQVFAATVHRLAMDGRFDIDAPLVGMTPPPDPEDTHADKLTARHLLGHGAGWRNWRAAGAMRLESPAVPASRFGYSGEGFVWIHRAVEEVLGRSMIRLMEELVMQPAGMTRSTFLADFPLDENYAPGHERDGTRRLAGNVRIGGLLVERATGTSTAPRDLLHRDVVRLLTPDGGTPPLPVDIYPNVAYSLLTTPADYSSFVRWLLNDRMGSQLLERMVQPVTRINQMLGWGAGIGLEENGGRHYAWQWGDNPGYKNFLAIDLARRSAVLAFTNADRGRAVYERVIRSETGIDHAGFMWV